MAVGISPAEHSRLEIRQDAYSGPAADRAPGFVQANLVVLPHAYLSDFLLFASRNPKPCPVLEVVEYGTEAVKTAPNSDLRTDLPGYRLFENGKHVASAKNANQWWRDDLVSVLLGCSFSFEAALMRAGIVIRHLEIQCNVPMFITNQPCHSAGKFAGPMVVSMRPVQKAKVDLAVEITEQFQHTHGTPVHIGNPEKLGISSLSSPDFGDAVETYEGELPVFWACGVTPQIALQTAKPDIAITHEPGQMFITDLKERDDFGRNVG